MTTTTSPAAEAALPLLSAAREALAQMDRLDLGDPKHEDARVAREHLRQAIFGFNPQPASELLRYAQAFGHYNARRYSRPWIGKVTAWPVGGKPEIEFGSYVGDDSGGEVEIMARPGDIIRFGQRDLRGNGGVNDWAIAQPDGTHTPCTQAEARAAFKGAR